MRKTAAFAAFLLCTLAALSSWGDDKAFRFRLSADPITLDWTYGNTNFETYAMMNIMEGLVELDGQLKASPGLAQRWDVSSDGRVYTFHLRPEVKWSDGVPLKAADFVTSWKRLLSPQTKNEYSGFLFDVVNAEAFHRGRVADFGKVGVAAQGDHVLRVMLRRPVPYFAMLLSFWITFPQRQDLIEKHGKNWTSPAHLVTLGPYRVAKWERGKEIVFERNPRYHGRAPSVSKVVGVIETDDAKARALLTQGKIDALLEIRNEDVARYAPTGGAWQLRQFDYLAQVYLAFNTTWKPSSNPDFRKAVAQAIDRSRIPATMQGGQTPADSFIPRGIAGYDPEAGLPVNPETARQMLRKAGYGDPKSVPSLTLIANHGRGEEAAYFVRDSLKEALGLKVEVRIFLPPQFKRERSAGRFHMYIGQWGADYPDPATFMEVMLSDSGTNFTRWKNARYDALVRAAGGSLKVLERLKDYGEAQSILLSDEAVVVPLFYPKTTALVSSAVAAFEISPLNYLFFKTIALK